MSLPSGAFTPENPSLFSDDNSNQTQEISGIGEQNVVKETVGLDLGNRSSNKKQKKLRSHAWNNFEAGGSASGDKPAEDSVMDQQLNRLDMVKMLIKQWSSDKPFPESIVADDLIDVYNKEKDKLRIYFEKLPCRFSLMVDMNDLLCKECICFWVYFIDDDWKLAEMIISWKCKGRDPFMQIFKNVLSDWRIDNKISYMVLDGYSYEHVLSSNKRENWFSSQGSLPFNGKLFCIRDFHSIGSINCILEILLNRMIEIFKYIKGNRNFPIAIDRAKSLGKKVTTEEGIPTEQELEVWGIVDLVRVAWGLKEAFFELENMDSEFKSINLTKEVWDLLPTFYDFSDDETRRCVFNRDKTLRYNCKTANMYFPWLCNIYTISLEFAKLKPSIYENESFQSLRDGMKCWYDDNSVLAVAAVLDPGFKMDIVEHWYKKIYGGECETRLAKFKDYLTNVYNEYAMLDPSGKPNTELRRYLEKVEDPLIRDSNILESWRSNTQDFPTLARMARDFLSIKITIPDAHLNHKIPKPHMHLVQHEAFVCVRNWLES